MQRDRTEVVARRATTLANELKVLADTTRLAILLTLMCGPHTVGQMASRFQLSQPTVSEHMRALRDEGFVEAARVGHQTPYSANHERLATVLRRLERALQPETRY